MNYCVIAIRDNFQFRAIFCRCKHDVLAILQDNYQAIELAEGLVNNGDICKLTSHSVRHYARDRGFNWATAQPSEFECPKSLFDYVRAAAINTVYIFERNEWRKLDTQWQPQFKDRPDSEAAQDVA